MSNSFILLFISTFLVQNVKSDIVVSTKVGDIRGLKADDGDYSMFMGIPYAQVDENNPFGEARPYPKFDEIFNAFDHSVKCPQREEFNYTIVGTLDCLRLNIYVPSSASTTNKLPVIVYIYGGAFEYGFSGKHMYGPSYLVNHDVILVNMNYRTGPYGFMCLNIPEVPGNQALKDQLKALRWVNNNIDAFGGNKDDISLFGHSAGAIEADLHLLVPNEKLFSKLIIESGSTFHPYVYFHPETDMPFKLATEIGYKANNLSDALTFLAHTEPKDVIAASVKIGAIKQHFIPCIEKKFEGVESFLTEYPINMKIPQHKNVPVLIGTVRDEDLKNVILDTDTNKIDEKITTRLKWAFDFDPKELEKMADFIKHFYFGDEELVESEKIKQDLIRATSDYEFNHPAERSINKYLDNGVEKVYHYVFSYDGGRNFGKIHHNINVAGVTHADELGYLFDMEYLSNRNISAEDRTMIERMTTMWTNFAKTSDPTPTTTTLLPVKWEPITKASPRYCLDIDSEMKLIKRPNHQSMAFWDLFFNANWKKQRGYKDKTKEFVSI